MSGAIRGDDATEENRSIVITAAAAALSSPDPAAASSQLPDASSLAEELSAIMRKLGRLRVDKEKTDSTLKEKDAKLDAIMKEFEERGKVQKRLEIEVDRSSG